MADRQTLKTAFDSLIALREYLEASPTDAPGLFVRYCAEHLSQSHSQLFQDLFVLFVLNAKQNGFFVEFGATDGKLLSNTFLLEQKFRWNGILAEPAKCWHAALQKNRKAAIDTRCVWSETGSRLEFKEAGAAEVLTLSTLVDKDFNKEFRAKGTTYAVDTVSLNDLLKAHNCPREIDYMSVDTEGSELAVLSAFDFAAYDIKILTVEHNFVEPDRQKIHDMLAARSFVRVFTPISMFDDWYIQRSLQQ